MHEKPWPLITRRYWDLGPRSNLTAVPWSWVGVLKTISCCCWFDSHRLRIEHWPRVRTGSGTRSRPKRLEYSALRPKQSLTVVAQPCSDGCSLASCLSISSSTHSVSGYQYHSHFFTLTFCNCFSAVVASFDTLSTSARHKTRLTLNKSPCRTHLETLGHTRHSVGDDLDAAPENSESGLTFFYTN